MVTSSAIDTKKLEIDDLENKLKIYGHLITEKNPLRFRGFFCQW